MASKMTTFRQLLGVFAIFLVRVLTGACIKIPAIVRKYSGNATDTNSPRQRPLSGRVIQDKYNVQTLGVIQNYTPLSLP